MERLLKEIGPRASKRVGNAALRAGARVIVKAAKATAPEDTGRLKRSISSEIRRKSGGNTRIIHIGILRPVSRMFHLIEFGTKHMAARPFLRNAFSSNAGKALDAIGKIMARGITREALKLARKG